MPETPVMEYKCPCCGAPLTYAQEHGKLACASCGNTFELDAVKAWQEAIDSEDISDFSWEPDQETAWSEDEKQTMRVFTCPSCGGELVTDENTAATFCPYCENPAILSGRLSGGLRPEGVIPFRTTREDAQAAFRKLCKGKPLLPKFFTEEQRIEKITGIYVPYWLYDCDCAADARYQATRVRTWSDPRYIYTTTDHFLLVRAGEAAFSGVPMDGSKKMEDGLMESLEPFDRSELVDFDTAYLSGFFADKYDVDSAAGKPRIEERVGQTMDGLLIGSCVGYAGVIPAGRNLQVRHGSAKYVLLPVWMLHTTYRGKTYVFAMNGQTGKMTGTFPISTGRCWAWFGGICAAVTALVSLLQWLVL